MYYRRIELTIALYVYVGISCWWCWECISKWKHWEDDLLITLFLKIPNFLWRTEELQGQNSIFVSLLLKSYAYSVWVENLSFFRSIKTNQSKNLIGCWMNTLIRNLLPTKSLEHYLSILLFELARSLPTLMIRFVIRMTHIKSPLELIDQESPTLTLPYGEGIEL